MATEQFMSMIWQVHLSGAVSDLEMLCESSLQGTVRVSKDGSRYFLHSEEMDRLTSAREVKVFAEAMIAQLNGAAKRTLYATARFEFCGLSRVNDDGTREQFVFVETAALSLIGMPVSMIITRPDGSSQVIRPTDRTCALLDVALRDRSVSNVLQLCSGDDTTWVNLYRICEVIEEDSGGLDAIQQRGWAKRSEMRLFKHTAQSSEAIGKKSRHGLQKGDPPSPPMSDGRAKELILGLVDDWLRDKLARSARAALTPTT